MRYEGTGFSTYASYHVSGKGYAYTRFGTLRTGFGGSPSRSTIAFHQGERTVEMPTQGTATYKGVSTHALEEARYLPTFYPGTMEADVDFGTKNVALRITPNKGDRNFSGLDLNGKINGNGIEGTSNDTVINGAFYGPNVEEMAGYYYKPGYYQGSFGGHKQP